MKLISLEELRTFVEKKESDVKHDALFNTLIAYVSKRIETFVNRELVQAERTERYNGGRRYYPLPAYPILASPIPVVTVDGVTKDVDDDYFVDLVDGIIEFELETLNTKVRNVSITWTGGYAEVDVDASTEEEFVLSAPDDLKRACLFQCNYEYRRRKDMGQTVVSGPQGSTHVANPADLLPEVKNILKSYRKPPSGR